MGKIFSKKFISIRKKEKKDRILGSIGDNLVGGIAKGKHGGPRRQQCTIDISTFPRRGRCAREFTARKIDDGVPTDRREIRESSESPSPLLLPATSGN